MRREALEAFAPYICFGIGCRAGMPIGLPAKRREFQNTLFAAMGEARNPTDYRVVTFSKRALF